MNIKIDPGGYLLVERSGKWKMQSCPFSAIPAQYPREQCGDWCPLFAEPENGCLMLCHYTLVGTITDERGKK